MIPFTCWFYSTFGCRLMAKDGGALPAWRCFRPFLRVVIRNLYFYGMWYPLFRFCCMHNYTAVGTRCIFKFKIKGSTCSFPNCTATSLATMDVATVDFQVKRQLPNGGITVTIPNNAAPTIGNVWVIWQEPGNLGTFSTGGSDNCPTAVASLGLSPAPRCVYAPFRL